MDNVMWVVSIKKFWTWTPVFVCETRDEAEGVASALEHMSGKQYKVDRVELR